MKNALLLAFLIVVGISCNSYNNCSNENPIFDKFLPESDEYKTELLKQLKTVKNPEFVFEKYSEENQRQFIYVAIKSDSLCATAILEIVTPNSKLDDIISKKGAGYHRAELKNLQYEADGNNLVFKDLDDIID